METHHGGWGDSGMYISIKHLRNFNNAKDPVMLGALLPNPLAGTGGRPSILSSGSCKIPWSQGI